MNRSCESTLEALATGEPFDTELQRHVDQCPRCAGLAQLPASIGTASRAHAAVEVGAGFPSRMVARAGDRLAERRRQRMGLAVAAVAAGALAAGGVYMSGRGTDGPVIADRQPSALTESVGEGRDQGDAPWTATEEPGADDAEVFPTLDSGLFQANWRAAGGHVAAGDIAQRTSELDLRPEQVKALSNIVAEQEKAEIELRAAIDVASVDLRTALDSERPDEARVGQLIDRISELEARVRKKRVLSYLEARALLDAKQRARLSRAEHDLDAHRHMTPPVAPVAPVAPMPPVAPVAPVPLDALETLDLGDLEADPRWFGPGLDQAKIQDEVRKAMEQARAQVLESRELMRKQLEQAHKDVEHMPINSQGELDAIRKEALGEAERARAREQKPAPAPTAP